MGSKETKTTVGQFSFGATFFDFDDPAQVRQEVARELMFQTKGAISTKTGKGKRIRDDQGNILLGNLSAAQYRQLMGKESLQLTKAAKNMFETK